MANNGGDETDAKTIRPTPPLPGWLISASILIGLLLAVGSLILFVCAPLGVPTQVMSLVLCVGLGLLLAAFGTQAEGVWRKFNIVGAGAVALILLMALHELTPCLSSGIHSLKYASGPFPDEASIAIFDRGDQLLGALDRERLAYQFVVEGNQFRESEPDVYFRESPSAAKVLLRLNKEKLNKKLAGSRRLDLRFDPTVFQVIDVSDGEIVGSRYGDIPPNRGTAVSFAPAVALLGRAFAADQSISTLVEKLGASDLRGSVDASAEIISKGPSTAPALVDQLTSRTDPRVRAEILSVLVSLVRASPEARDQVVASLNPEQLSRVIPFIGDPDRSVRLAAVEFLVELRDPEAVKGLTDSALGTGSANGRLNALYVLESLLADLPEDQASLVIGAIQGAAAGVGDARVKSRMQEFDQPAYYVVVASFVDEGKAISRAKQLRSSDYPDAEAYRRKGGRYFVVTLGRYRLREIRRVQAEALDKGAAGSDAWHTRATAFEQRVFPM